MTTVTVRRDADHAAAACFATTCGTIEMQTLESTNEVFDRLKRGKVNGRVVLGIVEQARLQTTRGHAAR